MKKIIFLALSVLIAGNAYAQSCAVSYGNVFTPAQSSKLCSVFGGGKQVLNNNTWLTARDAGNAANINVLKVDGTDETVLNADTGDSIVFSVGGNPEMSVVDDQLNLIASNFQILPGTSSVSIRDNADTVNEFLFNAGGDYVIRGTFLSTRTTDLGWTATTGLVNATCNTTCTNACVVGLDTDGAKTTFVGCASATAENCLCAGS